MRIKMLPFLLLTAIISLCWFPSYGNDNSKEISFPLSENPEERTTVILTDKSLLIRDLPKTENFNYIMLKLVGIQDTLPMKKCKNVKKETYDVKFSLQDVPNGSYFIEIYSAPKKYTTYMSYIRGQSICILVSDSSMDFVLPLTLAKNEEVFAANTQDSTAPTDYLKPSSKIESDNPTIIELANTITLNSSTDYEKVNVIHDWVSNNIWYDYDELNSGIPGDKSVVETVVSRKGICIDYASLTAALLRAVGVPARLEAGYVLNTSSKESWTEELLSANKSNHVWNEVYVDGRWIIIDTTYDSNNTYQNKTFSTGTGMKSRKYFDISIEFLSTDRYIVPNEFNPVNY